MLKIVDKFKLVAQFEQACVSVILKIQFGGIFQRNCKNK